jgi:hypothetical protein
MECQSGLGRDGERENRRLRRYPARLRENEQRRHCGVPCSHTVTATVVDAVGILAVSGKQSVSTTGNVGPSGPIPPNVDPARQDFDIAGNASDPINGRP